jgi:hypothetical protein
LPRCLSFGASAGTPKIALMLPRVAEVVFALKYKDVFALLISGLRHSHILPTGIIYAGIQALMHGTVTSCHQQKISGIFWPHTC